MLARIKKQQQRKQTNKKQRRERLENSQLTSMAAIIFGASPLEDNYVKVGKLRV